MSERWVARLSILVAVSMIVGLFGVWSAVGKTSESPLVTVGAKLGKVTDGSAVYGIQVNNQGAGDAHGVTAVAHLPEGFTARRVLPGGTCDAATCSWDIGDLAAGESRAFLVQVTFATSEALRERLRVVATSSDSPTSTHLSAPLVVSRQGVAAAAAGPPQCIDADPETGTGPANFEIQYVAIVTDGNKVTNGSEDGCDGAPVENVQVVWTIEDDDPDAWISNQDGTPTTKTPQSGDAQPDSVTTQTKPDGTTFIRIQLDETTTTGEGRYSARFGEEDVPEPGSSALCGVPIIGMPCPGEGPTEDDVRFTWTAASTATPTDSPTTGPTSTESPTPTASSPSPTPTETKSERQATLQAAADTAKAGTLMRFDGQITSQSAACVDDEFVRIQRRIVGEEAFSEIASTNSDSAGGFAVPIRIEHNAEYIAVLGETDACAEATSTPDTVLAKASVTTQPRPFRPKKGQRFTISGQVEPDKAGDRVILQRRKNGRWRTIKNATLDAQSEYSFGLRAKFKKRVFRVRWVSQDEMNESGGNRVVIKTRR
ncbi:MAG TPA: hypothetical protein VM573_02035 [Actinomycetota bacterium]|jgi:hypothetical protein|nr:hypothetical protein [Actinomycetota bacterium]